jgi:hypothetical protein
MGGWHLVCMRILINVDKIVAGKTWWKGTTWKSSVFMEGKYCQCRKFWLRIRTNGGSLWTLQWTFGLSGRKKLSWPDYKVLSCYEGACTMEFHLTAEDVMYTKQVWSGSNVYDLAVPWLRRLVAGLPLRSPGFDPGSVHVGFVLNNVVLGQVFSPSTSAFPCQIHSTGAPLLRKMKKTDHLSLYRHQRVASVASAAGTFSRRKKEEKVYDLHWRDSRFEFRPEHRLCWSLSWFCSFRSGKYRCLTLAHRELPFTSLAVHCSRINAML